MAGDEPAFVVNRKDNWLAMASLGLKVLACQVLPPSVLAEMAVPARWPIRMTCGLPGAKVMLSISSEARPWALLADCVHEPPPSALTQSPLPADLRPA